MQKTLFRIMLTLCFLPFALDLHAQEQGAGNPTQKKSQEEINFILDDESKLAQELFGPTLSKSLYKVVIDTFERPSLWSVHMPSEQGLILRRSILAAPLALSKDAPQEVKTLSEEKRPPRIRKTDGSYEDKYIVPYEDARENVLGVKVAFHSRGHHHFSMQPNHPVYVEGHVNAFEIWVAGRGKSHNLSLVVADVRGKEHVIPMGKLNFFGWKRLHVNVPDVVVQYDHAISSRRGLTFKGLLIQCAPLETRGEYYVYFDNLTAEVSRFWEEYQEQKDPVDVW